MTRTPVHDNFFEAVDTAINQLETTDFSMMNASPDDQEYRNLRDALQELIRTSPSPDDSALDWIVTDVHRLLNQICRYGSPELGNRDPVETLRQFRLLYRKHVTGEVSIDVLQAWVSSLNEDVIKHRPQTNIIGKYGLEKEFDAAVTKLLAEYKEN